VRGFNLFIPKRLDEARVLSSEDENTNHVYSA